MMKTPWEIQRSLFCCTEYECHKCYYERECEGRKMAETLLPDVLDFVVELKKERDRAIAERDAAIKCAQRFSYDNTKKCRWCKFAKYSESAKKWIPCAHPGPLFPFYPHCTRFEYVYREENAK